MIELPEAVTIARQIDAALHGATIASALRGNSPHRFAFYNREPQDYAAILAGRTVGQARAHGNAIQVSVEPDFTLVLGVGGERILLHPDEKTVPKKHQLLLVFADGRCLSVTVSGWGAAWLLDPIELASHRYANKQADSPLSDAFTWDAFAQSVAVLPPDDSTSAKYFIVSEPGVLGVGNGYLQDILFRARIHPRRRMVETTLAERQALYAAIRTTLQQAVDLDGRDTERDLYDCPGRYVRILDSRRVGKPCPNCGAPIQKAQYLGGAVYFCPHCQI